jgi:TDG/mug DNA glycosylase family protein
MNAETQRKRETRSGDEKEGRKNRQDAKEDKKSIPIDGPLPSPGHLVPAAGASTGNPSGCVLYGGAGRRIDPSFTSLPGLPDIIAPDLALLFVGFNPSVHSSRRGHYYAGPGNQFWRLLALAGLTPRLFVPEEDRELLAFGIGITDLCPTPTPGIDDVPRTVAEAGRGALTAKIERFRPRIVSFNGKATFERYFGQAPIGWGAQERRIGDAPSLVFVTPSSSGRANGVQAEREAAYRALGALVRETDPSPLLRSDPSPSGGG